jgi:hypothetical protein
LDAGYCYTTVERNIWHRAENPASGPGMYRDAQNQWVVDDSIRLEAGADADDAIEL